ncbi:hypothetical protein [Halobacteriovorax marinus]|nr:hypothetical protein [Halobacteriovorax marinus]
MTLPRKKLSNVFTLLLALNQHGVVKFEDISWLRNEFSMWANGLLRKINL